MTDRARIVLAAAVTVMFIVAIAVAGIVTHTDGQSPSSASAQPEQTAATANEDSGPAEQILEKLHRLVDGEDEDDD